MIISSLILSGSFAATVGSLWNIFSHLQGDSELGKLAPLDSGKTMEFSSAADFTHCPESDFGHRPLIWK